MTDQTQIAPVSLDQIDLKPFTARLASWLTCIVHRDPLIPHSSRLRRDVGMIRDAGHCQRELEGSVERLMIGH